MLDSAFRFPDFCSYLRQIISPWSARACLHHHYTNVTLLPNVPRLPRFRDKAGQNYCSRFSVSFPDLFWGTFVAIVPVCLLLTPSSSHIKMSKMFYNHSLLKLVHFFYILGRTCEESLGKIFVMKQSEMMMTNVCGLALGYQWDRLSNVVTGWVTVLTFGRRQLCSGQSGTDCQLWILGTFHEYSDQVIIYLVLIAETALPFPGLDWAPINVSRILSRL